MQKRLSLFLIVLGLALPGCAYFVNKPLNTLEYKDTKSHENLFVFLRGLGGSHRSFEAEGMVEEVRKRSIPFDMVAPNAHFGYYSQRTLVQRLEADVMRPARQKGYKNIWLVGISMGGLGSMLFIREKPEYVQGAFLISPFLGYDDMVKEIENQKGVHSWEPGEFNPNDDWERMLWHWIKTKVAGSVELPVFLGFGRSDRYRRGQKLLSTVLADDRFQIIEGGHDYATFKKLWVDFLDNRRFETSFE